MKFKHFIKQNFILFDEIMFFKGCWVGAQQECNRWIPDLQVNIGDYTVKDNFYVVNVADTNMVLGVQWLYSIGEHSMNYQIPQISFNNAKGKPMVLKGINNYPSQVISAKSMRSVMRHGDIKWEVEFEITTEATTTKVSS